MSERRLVQSRQEERVAHVVLDRPDSANLVTYAMMTQLVDALAGAKGCDVLAVSANGADFTLGRDQSERPEGVSLADGLRLILEVNELLRSFDGISVALVRGRALGFGSGLAMQCDLTIASETAVFGFDEITHGFPPLIVETYLGGYVPRKTALDLVLTGRQVTAAEALTVGMVSRVVSDEALEPVGTAVIEQLRSAKPSALRRAKSFLPEIDCVPVAERPSYGLRELASWREANG